VYHQWSLRWAGSPFVRFLGIANAETLLVTSMNAYREILQTRSSSFVKPELTRKCASVVVGEGLPFAEGNAHRQRKAALMRE
jgi:cytochrome P450